MRRLSLPIALAAMPVLLAAWVMVGGRIATP